ncbi:MAG: AMP-binding protein [Microscillaceae bacterium]|jgi:O-succinylbenzoic acid--CoA ligase|nr:AMP-binding protein [Microscillaceae bacterium]
MPISQLFLNGRYFTYEAIQTRAYLSEVLSDYERLVLNFCADWLNGKSEFSIQTSGSTGTPKTLTLHRAKMRASAQATVQTLDLQPNMRALVCLNVAYIGGMMMLVRGLEFGLDLWVIDPSGNPLADLRNKFRLNGADWNFDFMALVPLQLQNILHETPDLLPFLHTNRAIIVGGAAVSYALHTQIQAIDAPVYSTYGMTETISHIALQKLNGADRQTYFQALAGVAIETDSRGCLQIKAQVTDDKWLITNDLVELIDASKFRWLGRIDNVINSGGVKIQVEEVEKTIEKVFYDLGLANAFLVGGMPDEKLGQKLVLVIEGNPLPEVTQQNLEISLIKSLKKYEIPKKIIYFEAFNRTDTDKINRLVTFRLLIDSSNPNKQLI